MTRPTTNATRLRASLRRHAAALALAAVALLTAYGLSRGAPQPAIAADWEAAAAQGGWTTATPLMLPGAPGPRPESTVAALPEAYRHIRPASDAAGPDTIPVSELWPAQ